MLKSRAIHTLGTQLYHFCMLRFFPTIFCLLLYIVRTPIFLSYFIYGVLYKKIHIKFFFSFFSKLANTLQRLFCKGTSFNFRAFFLPSILLLLGVVCTTQFRKYKRSKLVYMWVAQEHDPARARETLLPLWSDYCVQNPV